MVFIIIILLTKLMFDELINETVKVFESTIGCHQFIPGPVRISVKPENRRVITQIEGITVRNVGITVDSKDNGIGTG